MDTEVAAWVPITPRGGQDRDRAEVIDSLEFLLGRLLGTDLRTALPALTPAAVGSTPTPHPPGLTCPGAGWRDTPVPPGGLGRAALHTLKGGNGRVHRRVPGPDPAQRYRFTP